MNTEPKERPIIFSGPMVSAILVGRKSQTRRIVKPQPFPDPDNLTGWSIVDRSGALRSWSSFAPGFSPYGQPGDRLWVREAFEFQQGGPIYDAAGGVMDSMDDYLRYRADHPYDRRTKWSPCIHMPRWASRILLEITGVRVERLQEISEADAVAEGIASRQVVMGDARCGTRLVFGLGGENDYADDAVQAFGYLWDQIHGPDSWDANPWVWVVEFRAVNA